MLSFHTNHRLLLVVPTALFAGLTALVAVVPAVAQSSRYASPGRETPVPREVARGRAIYQSEGCSYCHSQQVRGDVRRPPGPDGRPPVLEMDARFGRASRPEDYARDDPPFMGTERTGPDLQNVGDRLPSADWHYAHLFDPRMVSPGSVMPAYTWYFRGKSDHQPGDRRVLLTDAARERLGGDVEVWATPDAQALVAYLLWLKPSSRAP